MLHGQTHLLGLRRRLSIVAADGLERDSVFCPAHAADLSDMEDQRCRRADCSFAEDQRGRRGWERGIDLPISSLQPTAARCLPRLCFGIYLDGQWQSTTVHSRNFGQSEGWRRPQPPSVVSGKGRKREIETEIREEREEIFEHICLHLCACVRACVCVCVSARV